MSARTRDTDAAGCCAFCGQPLPIVNGQLQPWRTPGGLFFCNEFCADDAEEARFQSRGRADRKADENLSSSQTYVEMYGHPSKPDITGSRLCAVVGFAIGGRCRRIMIEDA